MAWLRHLLGSSSRSKDPDPRTRSGCRTALPEEGISMLIKLEKTEGIARNFRKRREPQGSILQFNCGLCKTLQASDPFTLGCGHTHCHDCVEEYVRKVVISEMAIQNPTVSSIMGQPVCPYSSCKEQLTQRELFVLLGSQSLERYSKWLAAIMNQCYGACLRNCPRLQCNSSTCRRVGQKVVLSNNSVKTSSSEDDIEIRSLSEANERYEIYKSLVELSNAGMIYRTDIDQSYLPHSRTLGPKSRHGIQVLLENKLRSFNPVKKSVWPSGVGYGGCKVETTNSEDFRSAELELDSRIEKQLIFLTGVLNGWIRDGIILPLPVATCALFNSDNILSQLLRQLAANDCMLDISRRSSLYLKMIDLLYAIRMHEELLPILVGYSRPVEASYKDCGASIESVDSEGTSNYIPEDQEDSADADKDNTVMKKMENIYRQAKVMLHRIEMPLEATDAGDVGIGLAREICNCYESLLVIVNKENSPATENEPDGAVGEASGRTRRKVKSEEDAGSLYKEKLKDLQFRERSMVDEKGKYRHYFKDVISRTPRGSHNHKRMLHLSKEIASLVTSLPLEWGSSIHLCVDEARIDVLRAMIVGPHGTPYQNGIFCFDIFLPPAYPDVPPLVRFTTGDGKFSFNPNLYPSGKVCLSLLGTWQAGPGWVSGKSSLLQVLVSLQSLVLVGDPYYNEPGFERKTNARADIENLRYREGTLKFGVLDVLRRPDPDFADIVREHFFLKREEVEQQCDEWIAADPRKGDTAKTSITDTANLVKAELRALCSMSMGTI